MTGNATMTRRATGCPRKKTIFGHFLLLYGSKWTETMLYDQGISLRRSGYPTCLYSEKIDPRPPGAQERAIWPLGGPFSGHRLGFWPENPFFCYCTPDFVNSPFVTLDDIFDFAPLHRFLVAVRPLGRPFSGHRAENPFFA